MFESIPEIMREAADIMLSAHNVNAVKTKSGDANFVTEYDIAVQNFLEKKLTDVFADAVVIGEESDNNRTELLSSRLCIIIDPIDGTTNFMHDYHRSAISVAISSCGTMVYGAVYDPYLRRLFRAEANKGAYLEENGRITKLSVSDRTLSDGLTAFGTSPYYRNELCAKTFRSAEKLFLASRDIRRAGSAALDLCDIACGSTDAFFEYRLSPWDYAAASLIIAEAGGVITQMDGSPLSLEKPSGVIAGNTLSHRELLCGSFFEIG